MCYHQRYSCPRYSPPRPSPSPSSPRPPSPPFPCPRYSFWYSWHRSLSLQQQQRQHPSTASMQFTCAVPELPPLQPGEVRVLGSTLHPCLTHLYLQSQLSWHLKGRPGRTLSTLITLPRDEARYLETLGVTATAVRLQVAELAGLSSRSTGSGSGSGEGGEEGSSEVYEGSAGLALLPEQAVGRVSELVALRRVSGADPRVHLRGQPRLCSRRDIPKGALYLNHATGAVQCTVHQVLHNGKWYSELDIKPNQHYLCHMLGGHREESWAPGCLRSSHSHGCVHSHSRGWSGGGAGRPGAGAAPWAAVAILKSTKCCLESCLVVQHGR